MSRIADQDSELFELLNGDLERYSTKGGRRLVITRLAKSPGVSSGQVLRRLEALREVLGDLEKGPDVAAVATEVPTDPSRMELTYFPA